MAKYLAEMEWAIYKEVGFLSDSVTFNNTC